MTIINRLVAMSDLRIDSITVDNLGNDFGHNKLETIP